MVCWSLNRGGAALDKYGILCNTRYDMNTQIISASDLRDRMAQVLSQIRERHSPCFITRSGKAVAALLPIGLYDEIMSALEDRLDEEDPSLASEVREARREYKAGRTVPLAKLKRLLAH